MTALSGSCTWTATSNASWITITSGSSGTGKARFPTRCQQHRHKPAHGNNDHCRSDLNGNSERQPAPIPFHRRPFHWRREWERKRDGISGSCTWTATSNASWITITSGSSGTGNGTVSYSVSSNTDTSQRTGQ